MASSQVRRFEEPQIIKQTQKEFRPTIQRGYVKVQRPSLCHNDERVREKRIKVRLEVRVLQQAWTVVQRLLVDRARRSAS